MSEAEEPKDGQGPVPPFDPAGGHQLVLERLALEIGDLTVQLRDLDQQIETMMRKQGDLVSRRKELTEQASAIARANRVVRGS